MLILSRKAGQQIVIGDSIVVSVMRTSGNQVRIGIDAPESVHIVRGELPSFVENQPLMTSHLLPDRE